MAGRQKKETANLSMKAVEAESKVSGEPRERGTRSGWRRELAVNADERRRGQTGDERQRQSSEEAHDRLTGRHIFTVAARNEIEGTTVHSRAVLCVTRTQNTG